MGEVRNRLGVVAAVLLAVSLVMAMEVIGTHSPEHASAWAAAAWLQQAAFWLGIVSAAGSLAAWLIGEVRRRDV